MVAALTVYGKLLPGRVEPILKLMPMVSSFDGRRFGCMVPGHYSSCLTTRRILKNNPNSNFNSLGAK